MCSTHCARKAINAMTIKFNQNSCGLFLLVGINECTNCAKFRIYREDNKNLKIEFLLHSQHKYHLSLL